ncbi:hypothetical protein SCLCIDRAFT_108361 [Scleroderma citrinum Foug A]|uniref:Uncharacterized protein n=1 Tax=Scleroderma citrinum Foug A TaxID=1036808 RepID=A0A0C3E3B9_9AGAM|nr:hypothetical protein SCLCIDRAFT_108361 [Scleroderma citrinum Foug A]
MKIFCTSPLPSLYHFLSEAFIGLYYYESFHGEQCARLNINRSVHGWKYHPSKMMIICAPLLFFSPVTSVHHLHTTFVDRLVIRVRWNAFVTRLSLFSSHTRDLTHSPQQATVLLGANVGFLGITSVDNGNEVSLRQISSYLSLMASFASIMLGLVFVQHNRTERWNSVFTVARFLGLLWDERHGPEKLTIVYSLPHAFLVWRCVIFSSRFFRE